MSIMTIFEQLARTAHHRVNFNELLKEETVELQQIFANNDASSIKASFYENTMLADRTTIFEL